MEALIKKKRGRKPKNFYSENIVNATTTITDTDIVEKKKRGRKKKYEIENFEKILNRNELNNFNHSVVYSDDEEHPKDEGTVKKISFGNLDITVSKKTTVHPENYKNTIPKNIINESEWESDEEKEIPVENFVQEKFEKHYNTPKKYTAGNVSDFKEKQNEESIKKIKVVTTIKNVLDLSEWPDKTDICCWWCCHKFNNCPCTLPTKYDSLRKRFQFVGIFCSWNCTKAYNFERNDHRKYERSQLITLLIQQLYGIVNAINIKAAPPRQTLKMFGGYLDISEFRDNNSHVDAYHMNLVKFNYIYPEITEISNVKIKTVQKNLRISRPI
jgi:hypothetical protein